MFLNIKRNVYLVHASYTHIVLFLYISNIPRSQMCYNTPMFYMTAIFVKYCYTTCSCYNLRADIRCSRSSPLRDKSL